MGITWRFMELTSYHIIPIINSMPTGYKNGKPLQPPSRNGIKASKETKLKMSLAKRNKKRSPFSDEWKQKISETLKRKYATGELKVTVSNEHREYLKSRNRV